MVEFSIPDTPKAAYEFIREYALCKAGSALADDRIFRGYQNRVSLPTGINDFVVYYVQQAAQRGTAYEAYSPDNEIRVIGQHWTVDVQINFWSHDDRGYERAMSLGTIGRTSLATEFFMQHYHNVIEVSGPRESPAVSEANQYVNLSAVTLKLEFDTYVSTEQPGSNARIRQHIEDVDAHHPPRRE
jgi:hypothetical protein